MKDITTAGRESGESGSRAVTPGRAAQELGLKRTEFDLAVQLGRIRTVPAPPIRGTQLRPAGQRRVTEEEIARIRSGSGFPETLRAGVRVMGTAAGAAFLDVSTARFTRFTRLGLLTPVRFYLNRYRVIVWLYLAQEVAEFGANSAHRPLLTGPFPGSLRAQLDAGVDLRARNWRGRHLDSMLALTDDPWARAAITASLLPPDELAGLVGDPHERACLLALAPRRPAAAPEGSLAAQRIGCVTTAQDPDEIQHCRTGLELCLGEARRARPAPRPEPEPVPPLPGSTDQPRRRPATRGPAAGRPPARPTSPLGGPTTALRSLRRLVDRALQ